MATNIDEIGKTILGQLEHAWNAGDGNAFGQPFAADADFVDIRGDHHHGREPIAAGHEAIMRSVYAGSRIEYSLLQARALSDDVLVIHSQGQLSVPAGPMAGDHQATQSFVLTRDGDEWQIASFHNTQVPPARGGS